MDETTVSLESQIKLDTLRKSIMAELNLPKLSIEDLEGTLCSLIGMESETFDNSMNDLVLRRYYNYFLTVIFPRIYNMIELKRTPKDHIKYADSEDDMSKKNINNLHAEAIRQAIEFYGYSVNDGFLINNFNSHEVHISDELLTLMSMKDIFRVKYNYNPEIATKFPMIEFDYKLQDWVEYAYSVQERLASLENTLNDKVVDFKQNLDIYEYHISLYREYQNVINQQIHGKTK